VLAAGGAGVGQPFLGAGALGEAGVRAAGLLLLQIALEVGRRYGTDG